MSEVAFSNEHIHLHVIFSFEKVLNSQMHSSSDFNQPIKKFPIKIPNPPHRGRIFPHLLTLFGKVWLFLDPLILSTPLFLWENSDPTLFGKISKTSFLLSTQLCLRGELGWGWVSQKLSKRGGQCEIFYEKGRG